MRELDRIEITVFERESDAHWVLLFRHGQLVETVDLNLWARAILSTRKSAEGVARMWLRDKGSLHVECPQCGARRGVLCKTGRWRAGAPNRPFPHKRRLDQVELQPGANDDSERHDDRASARLGDF